MMNKNEFISELDNALKGMSFEDKREIIYDYEEYFSAGKEHGKTEEEIAQALGDPKIIARQFTVKSTYKPKVNVSSVNLRTIGMLFLILFVSPFLLSAVCIVFSMGLVVVCLAFTLVLVLGSLLISFYACAVGCTLGGIGIVLAIFLRPVLPDFITIDINYGSAILLAIGVFCLGVLAFLWAGKFSKSSVLWSKEFLAVTWNKTKESTLGCYNKVLKYIRTNTSILNRKENEDA